MLFVVMLVKQCASRIEFIKKLGYKKKKKKNPTCTLHLKYLFI